MWYPKIGTYKGDRWLPAPSAENAAFSGDHGVFDVEISLPNLLQLANTGTVVQPIDNQSRNFLTDKRGREVEAAPDPDRKLNFIYRIHAEDMKDFSWAAAPSGSWHLSGMNYGETQVYFYCIPKNATQLRRLREATWNALRCLEEKFGPYPYPVLSIVDLPKEASSALASPTLAFISNISFDPLKQRIVPELAALNQVGDQFFGGAAGYGLGEEHSLRWSLSSWFAKKTLEREYMAAFSLKRFFMEPSFPEWYVRRPIPLGSLNWFHVFLSRGFQSGESRAGAWHIDRLEEVNGIAWMESEIRSCIADNYFGPSAKRGGLGIGGPEQPAWRIASVSRTPQGKGEITIEQAGVIGEDSLVAFPAVLSVAIWVRLENGEEANHVWSGQDRRVTLAFRAPIAAAEIRTDTYPLGQKDRLRTSFVVKPLNRGIVYWAQFVIGTIGGILQGIGAG
jgi:hypothetical protein